MGTVGMTKSQLFPATERKTKLWKRYPALNSLKLYFYNNGDIVTHMFLMTIKSY